MRSSFNRFRYFFLFPALLGVLALVPRPADGQQGSDRCFLWKVTSPTTTVYLLGSIHAKADLYPLPAAIEEAYAKSTKLVVEVDADGADQTKLQQVVLQIAKYPDGDTLSKNLAESTKNALDKYCTKKGIPPADLESLRPWFLSLFITLEEAKAIGFTDNGIDKHFLTKAKKQKKPIVELETAEGQLNLLNNLSADYQDQLLAKTLSDVRAIKGQLDKMTTAWKTGDAKSIEKMMLGDEATQNPDRKGLMAKIFDERNVKMAAKIDRLLKGSDSCFVVVGAGHLVGEKGIVNLLEGKRYPVEQVTRSAAKRKTT
jgi:uncharacterized protein YbaP (TraB family)